MLAASQTMECQIWNPFGEHLVHPFGDLYLKNDETKAQRQEGDFSKVVRVGTRAPIFYYDVFPAFQTIIETDFIITNLFTCI